MPTRTLALAAALIVAGGWVRAPHAASGSVSTTMFVGAMVVRSCSISAEAAAPAITLDCRKGSAELVQLGVDTGDSAQRITRVERVLAGPQLMSLMDADSQPTPTSLVVTIDF